MAQATFLGLDTGNVIDTVGFTIGAGGAVFDDTADTLVVTAFADDIQTLTPASLTEISGGALNIQLDVVSESLTHIFGTFFSYSATFAGQSVSLNSPTGGPAAEQDGRLLVSGDFSTSPNPTLVVALDASGAIAPTFSVTGTFDVTGGDSIFLQAFGDVGDLADILAASTSSSPDLATLFADGYLFSVRDVSLAACAAGGDCVGSITGSQNWSASGTGQISPQDAQPFVPEPGTAVLMISGLLGLSMFERVRRH